MAMPTLDRPLPLEAWTPAPLGLDHSGRRTATDLVPLGKTGLRICRLGLGTGSQGGAVQREMGQEAFTAMVRRAFERGVTFIDTADAYGTHEMVREAIRALPREELWIQTKMPWDNPEPPEKPLEVLDRYRTELGVDYIDSLLIHCTTRPNWDDELRPMMDAFDEAKAKGLIRLKGVSCHGLPALKRAVHVDWVDVQLARVNPQGHVVDGADGTWLEPGDAPATMPELRSMHATGRGMIGMKLVGNGDFLRPEEREAAMRYVMNCGFVDSVTVGFKSIAELEETIDRMNRVLTGS